MIESRQTLRAIKPVVPFFERTKRNGFTFGVGPAGYDCRIHQDVVLAPGDFKLVSTDEEFCMPDNMLGVVHDKSTWARLGLAAQNTVIEPGWRGFLTLELTNHNRPRPWLKFWGKDNVLRIKAGTPIVQVIFHLLDKATDAPYAGKYQDQKSGAQMALFD